MKISITPNYPPTQKKIDLIRFAKIVTNYDSRYFEQNE